MGFAVADQVVVDRDGTTGLLVDEITKIKSMVSVNTSALGQAAVGGMLLAADGRTADINVETSRYYGDATKWRPIAEYPGNGISDPFRLRPGAIIDIPRLDDDR